MTNVLLILALEAAVLVFVLAFQAWRDAAWRATFWKATADTMEHSVLTEPVNEPPTWNERMAAEICCSGTLSEGVVAGILEAAGELKAVRLKVLLGRCWEIIAESIDADRAAYTADGFLDEILEALK